MDVRCERCQTEYELDDSSVSESGTDVQCSACGHTFQVRRGSPDASSRAQPPGSAGRETEWLLESADGSRHRLDGLPSLQKWIIERRVTREDRVLQPGHDWRRLREMAELIPFFEVMDEADRARSAVGAIQEGSPGAGRPTPAMPVQAGRRSSPDGLAISVVTSARGSYPRPTGADQDTDLVALPPKRNGAFKIVAGLVAAVAVSYAGIAFQESRGRRAVSAGASPEGQAASAAPRSGAASAVPGAHAPESANPRPLVQPLPVEAEPPEPALPAKPPRPAEAAAPSPKVKARKAAARTSDGATGASYEKLVTDGDRLLENGAGAKAKARYEQALKLRPAGAEALSGLGYAALDRGQMSAATSYFKRAMVSRPFGPALFGLGEVYRSSGKREQALEMYERYLQVTPRGTDAAAAKRHIRTLEAGRRK